MKNRTLIAILCIAVAIVLFFCASPVINSMSSERISIVRVAKDIPEGMKISENDLVEIEVGKYNLPDDVIRKKSDVIGKYAATTLKRDMYILPSTVTQDNNTTDYQFRALKDGELAMSIPVASLEHGLSGALRKGDIVSIVITEVGGTAFIPQELREVTVITATASGGIEAEHLPKEASDQSIRTVTLRVDEEQALLLATYGGKASLHLALVQRGERDE